MAPTLDDVQVERPAPGTAVVVFSGEHDLATRSEVSDLFDSLVLSDDLVVADFSSAAFVDSSILRVLIDANRRAGELGTTFRLQLHTATIVRRAFEICGLLELMEHAMTREEALAPVGRTT